MRRLSFHRAPRTVETRGLSAALRRNENGARKRRAGKLARRAKLKEEEEEEEKFKS